MAGQAVAAAPDGELEAGLGGEDDGAGDVGRVRGLDDDRRDAVEAAVVDLAGLVEGFVAGDDERPGQGGGERRERAGLTGDQRGRSVAVGRGEGGGRAASMDGVSVKAIGRVGARWTDRRAGLRSTPTDEGRQPGRRRRHAGWTDDDGGRRTAARRGAARRGTEPAGAGLRVSCGASPAGAASGRNSRSRRSSRKISRSMIRQERAAGAPRSSRHLEQRLPPRRLDLEDPGEQVRQDRRVVRDRDPAPAWRVRLRRPRRPPIRAGPAGRGVRARAVGRLGLDLLVLLVVLGLDLDADVDLVGRLARRAAGAARGRSRTGGWRGIASRCAASGSPTCSSSSSTSATRYGCSPPRTRWISNRRVPTTRRS